MLKRVLGNKKLFSLSIASVLAVSNLIMAAGIGLAASASDGLTAAQLTAMLKESEKKDGSSVVSRVIGTGPNVTVMAQSQKTASEKDLKIDAVFYAKKLIESASGTIERVEVIYSAGGAGDGKFISIDNKTISDYGSGKMSAEGFLSALHFSPVTPDDLPSVEPGPQKERRLLIVQRIETLRKEGTGVKPFQTIFQSIESAIKSGDTNDLSTKLTDIETRLTEQEEQVAIAKRTASGHGVIQSKSFGPFAQSNSGMSKEQMQENFQRAKNHFLKNGATVIEKISQRNVGEAARLGELKKQIDSKLSSNKSEEAFPLMNAFWNEVDNSRGHEKNRAPDGEPIDKSGPMSNAFVRQGMNNRGNKNRSDRYVSDYVRGRRMKGEQYGGF